MVPCCLFLLAAALCSWSRTRGLWRSFVCATCVLAYNAVLWPDALIDMSHWSGPTADYSTMLQARRTLLILPWPVPISPSSSSLGPPLVPLPWLPLLILFGRSPPHLPLGCFGFLGGSQCAWLLIAAQFTALGFSLDFVHVLVTV